MTTPQNQLYKLYKLADNIKRRIDLFEGEEDEDSFFETLKQMKLEILDLINSQQRLENKMILIINYLAANEKSD